MWIVDTQSVIGICYKWIADTQKVSLEYVTCGLWTHRKCHWNMLHVDCGHRESVIGICYMWIVDTQKVSLEYATCGLWTQRKCHFNMLRVDCGHTESVIGIFHWHNPSDRTMALGSTQPLTEMSTWSISWGKGGQCIELNLTTFMCWLSWTGSLNPLEPSRSLQARTETA